MIKRVALHAQLGGKEYATAIRYSVDLRDGDDAHGRCGIRHDQVTVIKDAEGHTIYRHEALAEDEHDYVTVTVKAAPPEPMEEVVRLESKPNPKAVWIPGYWRWDAGEDKYEWVSGVWRREIPDTTWKPGKWIKVGDDWEWQPGYWASKDSPDMVVVKITPPDPLKEEPGAAPGIEPHLGAGCVEVRFGYWQIPGSLTGMMGTSCDGRHDICAGTVTMTTSAGMRIIPVIGIMK